MIAAALVLGAVLVSPAWGAEPQAAEEWSARPERPVEAGARK